MQFNICETCGACDGRAGILFGLENNINECENCKDTRETYSIVLHTHLIRTEEEIQKTFKILENAKL